MTEQAAPTSLLTPAEAARRLGIDKLTADPERVVLAMARRGELVSVRVSKWKMITPGSLDAYLARARP